MDQELDQHYRLEVLKLLPSFNNINLHTSTEVVYNANKLYEWIMKNRPVEITGKIDSQGGDAKVSEPLNVTDEITGDECCGCGGCFQEETPSDDVITPSQFFEQNPAFSRTWYIIEFDVVLVEGTLDQTFLVLDDSGYRDSIVRLGDLKDVDGVAHQDGQPQSIYRFATMRALSDTRKTRVFFGGRASGFVSNWNVRLATAAEILGALGDQ